MTKRITKSNYVTYLKCPKALWLNKYRKDLSYISDSTKARLESGTMVGDLAMGIFGEYVDVTTMNNGFLDIDEMINKTNILMENNTTNICEASFLFDNLYCAVDILHKTDNGYEIYEVKSTTNVEDYHIIDTSFQMHVLKQLGINVTDCYIITINNKYIRHGEIEINKLFNITKITDMVLPLLNDVPNNIIKINELLSLDEPQINISRACEKPYECEFKGYCYKDIPSPSIFDLANNRSKLKYYNDGIITYEQLINSQYYDKLSDSNKLQIRYELNDLGLHVNKDNIKAFLSTLKYPLYLLDFESFQPVIPPYDGIRPYQQVTFQYSLHIIYEDMSLEHREFLAKDGVNPTYELALALINDIPENSMIMAYNMGFEKSRIRELANMYPNLKNQLDNMKDNFVDLMIPFQSYDVYKREFNGSYSIKYVLPGLFPNDPELDYHNLDLIHNGNEAMTIFENLSKYSDEDKIRIRKSLLEYCKLDTYAMVKILNKLYELVK